MSCSPLCKRALKTAADKLEKARLKKIEADEKVKKINNGKRHLLGVILKQHKLEEKATSAAETVRVSV